MKPTTTTTKPTTLKHTDAELAAAFRKAMTVVFDDMSVNAKRVEAARKARLAAANPRRS